MLMPVDNVNTRPKQMLLDDALNFVIHWDESGLFGDHRSEK